MDLASISNPVLRLILGNDGLMTRTMENLFQNTLQVQLLQEDILTNYSEHGLNGEVVYRETVLSVSDMPVIYAKSYWDREAYDRLLRNAGCGIGRMIMNKKLETFREIQTVGQQVYPEGVYTVLKEEGVSPLYYRRYCIHHQAQVLCVIEEALSSHLVSHLTNLR